MMLRWLSALLVCAAAMIAVPVQAQDPLFHPSALESLPQLFDIPAAERTCASGKDDDLCGWLGLVYLTGTGVAKDVERGRQLVYTACGVGSTLACAVYNADNNDNQTQLRQMLHPVFLSGCTLMSFGPSCFNAAQQLQVGYDVKQDLAKADALFVKGCAFEHGKSCHFASQMAYLGKEKPVDMAAAFQLGLAGCNLNEGAACLMAIAAAQSGKIPAIEPALYARLTQDGCVNGEAQLCDYAASNALAKLPDAAAEAQAPRFARIGCEGKRGVSCRLLGQMLSAGQGIAKDEAAALSAFEQGCERKDALSCYNVGVIAYNARNDARAKSFFERTLAIKPGHPEASAALAKMPAR